MKFLRTFQSLLLAFTLGVLVFYPLASALASGVILERIDVTGNIKTKEITILREVPFKPGDTVSDELLDQGLQAVKDLGLFEWVKLNKEISSDGSMVVEIEVKEKRFNFILPKINRNGDGDVTTGLVWRSDNLFGRNQKSKFTIAYRKFSDSDEEEANEVEWKYTYPRIKHTPYSLEFVASDEETRLEETVDSEVGEYDRSRTLAKLLVGRWLIEDGPSQGLNIRVGPSFEKYDHEFVSGTPGLLPDESIKAVNFSLDGYYVHDNLLSRSGYHFRYDMRIADDITGSSKNFVEHRFFYRKYVPLGGLDHQNLNFQLRFGTISDSILGPPQYKIGGSSAIRGYDRDAIEGNIFGIMNIEYLRPIRDRETLRGVFFVDVGNAWNDSSDVKLTDLKVGTGFGLRWKLKRFVRTDVRLDIARGLSSEGETKAYLSTRATF